MELIASRKKDKKQSYTKRKEVSVFLNIAKFFTGQGENTSGMGHKWRITKWSQNTSSFYFEVYKKWKSDKRALQYIRGYFLEFFVELLFLNNSWKSKCGAAVTF